MSESRSSNPPAKEAAGLCGAKLRSGGVCSKPPVTGRSRCRSHGCAPGTGAPLGNQNALKHGKFTREMRARGTAKPGWGAETRFREAKASIRRAFREGKKRVGKEPKLALPRHGRWTHERIHEHVGELFIKQERYWRMLAEVGMIGFVDEARARAHVLRELYDNAAVFESQESFESTLKFLSGLIIIPRDCIFADRYREARLSLCESLIAQSIRLSDREIAFRRDERKDRRARSRFC